MAIRANDFPTSEAVNAVETSIAHPDSSETIDTTGGLDSGEALDAKIASGILTSLGAARLVIVAGMCVEGGEWLSNAAQIILSSTGARVHACSLSDFDPDQARDADFVVVRTQGDEFRFPAHAWRVLAGYRDLRDVGRFARDARLVESLQDTIRLLGDCVLRHDFWSAHAQIDLAYETMASEPEACLQMIVAAFGVRLSSAKISQLARDFEASRLPSGGYRLDGTHRGTGNSHEGAFAGRIDLEFSDWLRRHGYPASTGAKSRRGLPMLRTLSTAGRPAATPTPASADVGVRRVLVVFDARDGSHGYRAFSYLSNVLRQLGNESTYEVLMLGRYTGPLVKGPRVRLRAVPVARPLHERGLFRLARRVVARARGADSSADWFSSIDGRRAAFLEGLGRGPFTDLVLFTPDAGFAKFCTSALYAFAEPLPLRACAVLTSGEHHSEADLARMRFYGLRIVFDATEFEGHSSNCGGSESAFSMDDPSEALFRAKRGAPVNWRAELEASRLWTERPEVVLFVRPDWMKCGSATTFGTLSENFRVRGAIVIDVALQHGPQRYEPGTVRSKLEEVEADIAPALHFNFQRGAWGGRVLHYWRTWLAERPRTVAGLMPLIYARCVVGGRARRLLKSARIDYAYVNHYFTMQVVSDLRADLPVLLDMHDVQSANYTEHGYGWVWRRRLASFSDCLREEVGYLRRADLLTTVSVDEIRVVQEALPDSEVFLYLPVPKRKALAAKAPRRRPGVATRLLIVASRNPANERSLEWFLTQVWPRVVRPGIALEIVGSINSYFGERQFPQVAFRGVVPDLEHAYGEADLVLLPITNGGGIAIKTLEAFQHGKPVTATSHALRGLPEDIRAEIPTVDDERDMIADLHRLTSDAHALSERARATDRALGKLRAHQFDSVFHGKLDQMRDYSRGRNKAP